MQLSEDVNYDAVVFGAGPVGAAVALGLQQQGYSVCVFERRSEQAVIIDAGKSINLSLSTRGNALMKELGVYDELQSTLVPMVKRRFPNGSTEVRFVRFACYYMRYAMLYVLCKY